MSELQWLSEYSGETTTELIALEPTFRKDSIVLAFEQALGQKSFRLGGDHLLTMEERVVLAVEALEREVCNGGYSQYFLNIEENLLNEVVDALECISRSEIAALTQRALDIRDSNGKLQGANLSTGADAALEECDAEYFRIAGDLAEPLFEFIKQAQDHINLP